MKNKTKIDASELGVNEVIFILWEYVVVLASAS